MQIYQECLKIVEKVLWNWTSYMCWIIVQYGIGVWYIRWCKGGGPIHLKEIEINFSESMSLKYLRSSNRRNTGIITTQVWNQYRVSIFEMAGSKQLVDNLQSIPWIEWRFTKFEKEPFIVGIDFGWYNGFRDLQEFKRNCRLLYSEENLYWK